VASGITWRVERAKVLARRGRLDAANRFGCRAVELVRGTDLLVTRAVLMDQAEVLQLSDRGREALPLQEAAAATRARRAPWRCWRRLLLGGETGGMEPPETDET
jgi:hypothetical protein